MQGRFKRDGSAAAEPEPRGGSERGSTPQHAPNPGSSPSGDGDVRGARPASAGGPAAPAPKGRSAASSGPGSRLALRNWRISTRLVSLLALPVVAATSLGALRINESMDDMKQLDNMKLLTDMTKQATELAAALQEERDQSAGPVAHGAKASDYLVKGARDKTDRELQAFREGTQAVDDASSSSSLQGVRENVVQITRQLATLKDIRNNAYQDRNSVSQTVDAYSQLVGQLLGLSQDMAQATSNPEMIRRTRALAAFSSAKEYASVQRAVIAAALPPNNTQTGKLSETDRRYALSANDKEQSELTTFSGIYAGNPDELLKPIDEGNPTIKEASTYAQHVLSQEGGIKLQEKRSYKDWVDADSTKVQAMSKIELTLLNEMEQKARELRNDSERDAIINGALILLVLGVSLVGAFVVARSMIRSLRRLQETATQVAQDRLPELVKHLSEADPQDVDTSVESVGVHSRDEIGQVAAAFDDVHREAVRLASEQAMLRGNVNAMFTNLSRRSQGLIQRQLSLISELESREADPDQLSSLFKLDHLATRMRRNGENLLVLAGEEPGRRWTRPVPLVDVLRAAASEVEQYERIELAAVPATEVAGRVVNDLVHLLAELLENATSFSSPQTKVKVTGHALPDGRVLIEIHDTGIGLSPEDLASINERLAAPPTVDVSVSRRMGLFVVGRLSQRHGIRIQLRPSDSGGTTALVMLPVDVAQGGRKAPGGKPGAPTGGGPAAAQAAAGVAAARRAAGAQGGPPGRLGATAQRGQVAGSGPRAALPSRDTGPRDPGRDGGQGGLFGGAPQQDRPAAAFGQGPAGPQGLRAAGPGADEQGRRDERDGRPQLPPRGGPRAELPGGPQQRVPSWSNENARPPVTHTPPDVPRGHDEPDSRYAALDDGRGRDERQGAGSTGQFAAFDDRQYERRGYGEQDNGFPERPSDNRPASGLPTRAPSQGPGRGADTGGAFGRGDDARGPGSTGQFPVYDDRQGPGSTSEFPAYDERRESGSTGQFPRPDERQGAFAQRDDRQGPGSTGQFPVYDERQGPGSTGQFPAVDERQGPGSTSEFPAVPARPGSEAPPSAAPGSGGQFVRSDVFGGPPAAPPGAPLRDGGYGGRDEAASPRPGSYAGPGGRPGGPELPQRPGPGEGRQNQNRPAGAPGQGENLFGAPLPGAAASERPAPQARRDREALPPAAGPGDGRTPLYDTLETNWFHGGGREQAARQRAEASSAQLNGSAGASGPGPSGPAGSTPGGTWRSSPNDELNRQAERVRQPSAGGVTTSGLPRRVPRANLVAGTAQQQQPHQAGPQVSRAPDDVRGRLTNLRRGIQQGRQAGSGSATGSHPSPTHQQER